MTIMNNEQTNKINIEKDFEQYVERMKRIRALATPDITEIKTADEYSKVLIDHFRQIGVLAEQNYALIEDYIMPMRLPREELERFNEMLVNEIDAVEVDVHLSDWLMDKLMLSDIEMHSGQDDSSLLSRLFVQMRRAYYRIASFSRYHDYESERVREQITKDAKIVDDYLAKERFAQLSVEARRILIECVKFAPQLYNNNEYPLSDEYCNEQFAIVERALSVCRDSFYRKLMPDYDWQSYKMYVYLYACYMIYADISQETAHKVYRYIKKLKGIVRRSHSRFKLGDWLDYKTRDFEMWALVVSGKENILEAGKRCYRSYSRRNQYDYSDTGILKNLDLPASFISLVKNHPVPFDEDLAKKYEAMAKGMLEYLYRIPKLSSQYFRCMIIFINLLMNYMEMPGILSMEDLCLNAFITLHPPSYIHSRMVAQISSCLSRHLAQLHPELLEERWKDNRFGFQMYAYHAGLCHDIGKLFIIDTICMYGRPLFDEEFEIIKKHPSVGAGVARKYDSLRDYMDVIRYHHVWYDGSRGYPDCPQGLGGVRNTAINIVHMADCMDAATDVVGRSYKAAKTLDQFIAEAKAGSGTEFAPYVVELLQNEKVKQELDFLLYQGRQNLYQETYLMLMQMKGK